jgi:hemerythrin-like metal-binding protein
MDWIKWDHTLELGHEGMDSDHRQLVALVNQLANGIVNNLGKEAYDALLDDLFAHTRAHFGMEERLMAAGSYPDAKEHRAEHATLIKDALEYRARFDASAEPSISLLYFFDQWLTRHILASDRELANFLAGNR